MSIRIRSTALQTTAGTSVPADGFLDKIVKSIPSQVIAFYTAALVFLGGDTAAGSATASAATGANQKLWIPFVLGIILTPLLTWRQTQQEGKPPAYLQILVATFSFVVWAFATAGPFMSLSFWSKGLAAVVLAAYTVVLGLIPQN
jgi:hypothetical protein